MRIGVGQFMADVIGQTGVYSNLIVSTPGGVLTVNVGPTPANTVGAIYQYLAEDPNPIGGPGATQLPADNNKVVLQGTSFQNGPAIGPLTVPGTAGQSQISLIECQVQVTDQNPQLANFINSLGILSSQTVNRDRADIISCQAKAGVAATTGSEVAPTVDAGWVAIGQVDIPQGTTALTSGMITAVTTAKFSGFVDKTTNQTAAGIKTWTNNAIFNAGLFVNGGGANPSVAPGDGSFQRSATTGAIFIGGNSLDYGAGIAGAFTFSKALNVGASSVSAFGDLGAARSTSSGALTLGGGVSSALIDYGITTVGVLTMSKPATMPAVTINALPGTPAALTMTAGIDTGTGNGLFRLGTAAGNYIFQNSAGTVPYLSIGNGVTVFSGGGLTGLRIVNALDSTSPSLRTTSAGDSVISPAGVGSLYLGNDAASITSIIYGPSSAWGVTNGTGTKFKGGAAAAPTLGFVPPMFTAAGASLGTTAHGVVDSCTTVAASSCTITLSGAAAFTSATSYACGYSTTAGSVSSPSVVTANSGTLMTVSFFASANSTALVTCFGT